MDAPPIQYAPTKEGGRNLFQGLPDHYPSAGRNAVFSD
jgi:hypothetical protein